MYYINRTSQSQAQHMRDEPCADSAIGLLGGDNMPADTPTKSIYRKNPCFTKYQNPTKSTTTKLPLCCGRKRLRAKAEQSIGDKGRGEKRATNRNCGCCGGDTELRFTRSAADSQSAVPSNAADRSVGEKEKGNGPG